MPQTNITIFLKEVVYLTLIIWFNYYLLSLGMATEILSLGNGSLYLPHLKKSPIPVPIPYLRGIFSLNLNPTGISVPDITNEFSYIRSKPHEEYISDSWPEPYCNRTCSYWAVLFFTSWAYSSSTQGNGTEMPSHVWNHKSDWNKILPYISLRVKKFLQTHPLVGEFSVGKRVPADILSWVWGINKIALDSK
jgi:hypothetical protein